MPVLHEEIDAVLLERNGERIVFRYSLHHFHVCNIEFISAGRAFIGANFSGDDYGGFQCKLLHRFEHLRRNGSFWHNALDQTRSVAKNGEEELSAFAQVIKPATNGDALPIARSNLGDRGDRSFCCSDSLFFDFHKNSKPPISDSGRPAPTSQSIRSKASVPNSKLSYS